uniref:Uncharacterized protein LOC111108409 isoform X2 n=1 Tax=Crassostrea virginica TaxID=6565 RepID=A0A8B8B984_CRAVI|nr:uncharacterized protein LOC111108409 isoform X2 [Crassostrea virginica]
MKMKFLLFFYVVVRAISAELVAESSLLTGNACPKLSTVLQEILNRESLLRFTMTQKVLNLMVDVADSKKEDALISEKLQKLSKEIQALKADNQIQREEISNLNRKIGELQTSQMEGKTKLLSHLDDYQTFSLTVNETLQSIQENQSAGYIKLMDVTNKSGMLINNLKDGVKELKLENHKQAENVSEVKNLLMKIKLQSDELVRNLTNVAENMQQLEDENKKQNTEINGLEKEHTNFKKDILQIQTQQSDGNNDVLLLKESHLKLFNAVNETLTDIWHNLTANDNQLRDKIARLYPAEIPGNYAFYSELSTSITNGYVVFNNCKTNEGSAYDEMTGIFTCKYSGTYAFSWTIATSGHRYTEAELLVNDEVIGSSGTDSRPSRDTADSSTGFVACNLGVGDKVRIRVNGTADGNYSTFSGWRLPDGNSSLYARAMSQLNRPSTYSRGYPFQSVINNGNHYDSYKGIYTCPEDGLYAFTFTVEASNSRALHVYLYRSGRSLNPFSVFPDAASGDYVDTSSTLQIYSLSKGDTIYVNGSGVVEPLHSTFAVWRIGRTSSDTPGFMGYTSYSTSSKPLIYSEEVLDTSNSFNNTHFLAPKDGVYLFFWNMMTYKRRLESFLQVNDQTVGRTIGDGRTAYYDSSSNLVIVRLHKNDNVKVMHDGTADGGQTMISGYFLFP